MAPSQQQQPQPIQIPAPISLTSTSTTPSLPPATTQALIAHLRATNSIPELSLLLTDSLARAGWTDRVRALALELLRNGSCDTFPELMAEVTRRAKIPKSATGANGDSGSTATGGGGGRGGGKTTPKTNGAAAAAAAAAAAVAAANAASGVNGVNVSGAIAVSKEWSGGPDGLPDVRIPEATVDAGVEFLRDRIKDVVEPADDSDED